MSKKRTLLLDQGYQPIKAISWKRAICMVFLEKVEVVSEYQDWKIRTARNNFAPPAVIRLKKHVRTQPIRLRFSRSNIYSRDGKICQYCERKFSADKLTLDHVIPKSLGGKTNWTNIVTCCLWCNREKADRTPQQSGMRLVSRPSYPGHFSYGKYLDNKIIPKEWEDWITN